MKLRHIIVLGVIFLLLLTTLFARKIFVRPEVEEAEYKKLQISFSPQDIYIIEAKKAGQETLLRMERKESEWLLPSHWNLRANSSRIDKLLNEISQASGEQRSSSKELFSDYNISDDKAFFITLLGKDGDLKEKFFVGLKKAGVDTSFLRRGDSEDVYLVDRDIFSLFGMYANPEEESLGGRWWMDLSLLKLSDDVIGNIESIKIIRAAEGENIVTLDIKKELDAEKNLKRWVAIDKASPFDIDADKIKSFIEGMNKRKGRDGRDPKAEGYGFDTSYLKITFGAKDAGPIELVVGAVADATKGYRYLRTPEGYVYVIDGNLLRNIDIDMSNFFVNNPLKIAQGDLESIKIKSGKKSIELDAGLIGRNSSYVKNIERFYIDNLVLDKKYTKGVKGSATSTVDIKKKDKTLIKLYGKREDGKFLVQVDDKPEIFNLKQYTFESIFENLDKLNLAKE